MGLQYQVPRPQRCRRISPLSAAARSGERGRAPVQASPHGARAAGDAGILQAAGGPATPVIRQVPGERHRQNCGVLGQGRGPPPGGPRQVWALRLAECAHRLVSSQGSTGASDVQAPNFQAALYIKLARRPPPAAPTAGHPALAPQSRRRECGCLALDPVNWRNWYWLKFD